MNLLYHCSQLTESAEQLRPNLIYDLIHKQKNYVIHTEEKLLTWGIKTSWIPASLHCQWHHSLLMMRKPASKFASFFFKKTETSTILWWFAGSHKYTSATNIKVASSYYYNILLWSDYEKQAFTNNRNQTITPLATQAKIPFSRQIRLSSWPFRSNHWLKDLGTTQIPTSLVLRCLKRTLNFK